MLVNEQADSPVWTDPSGNEAAWWTSYLHELGKSVQCGHLHRLDHYRNFNRTGTLGWPNSGSAGWVFPQFYVAFL